MPDERIVFTQAEEEIEVRYQCRRDGSFVVRSDSGDCQAIVHEWSETEIDAEVDGVRTVSAITHSFGTIHVQTPNGTQSFTLVPRFVPPGEIGPAGGFVAQMPGTVIDVRVSAGDGVSAGDTLIVVEAMKMEHHMNAPADGVVAEVRVEVGGQIETGHVLLVFESNEEDA